MESLHLWNELPAWLRWLFVGAFGAIWGSFLNVCIYRVPLGKSLFFPPSRCNRCRSRIRLNDNIPLIGYFLRGGRCRYCGKPYSLRYAFVELLAAVAALALYAAYGLSVTGVALFVYTAAMLVVTFIDIDHRIIPDGISIGGAIIGLALAVIMPLFVPQWFVSPLQSLIGLLTGAGLLFAVSQGYRLLTGVEGIGLGDVKLLGMIGACFGWQVVIWTIVLSSVLGSLYGVILMFSSGRSSKYPMPFGPFIVAASLVAVTSEPALGRWFY